VVHTTEIQRDSLFKTDSILVGKSWQYLKAFDKIEENTISVRNYSWEKDYLNSWKDNLIPVMNPLVKQNIRVFAITKYTDKQMIDDFRKETGAEFPIYLADDILLKTIVRSNPGAVLLKDGKVIANWHINKLPDAEELIKTFGLGK
jgi:hypothetical protein